MSVLNTIVDSKRRRLAERKGRISIEEMKARAYDAAPLRDFNAAIRRPPGERIRLIAELKKASPSRGLIREDLRVEEIARIYAGYGASAISVLTEEEYFKGDIEFIHRVKDVASLPVIRKDFIFDEYQLYESRAYGADAILLIAAILSRSQAEELFQMAVELGLSVLFEVHHWKELDTALLIDVPIIGINNRNLKTLEIDLNITTELLKDIPQGKIIVSESGIERREDVEFFEARGVDALLVGTALMKSDDIGRKIEELFKV